MRAITQRWLAHHKVLVCFVLLSATVHNCFAQQRGSFSPGTLEQTTVANLETILHEKAKTLENSSGMRSGFQEFLIANKLSEKSVRYSDYVLIRLLYEATRDAGFWNLHWSITDQPPNSDRIWKQWKSLTRPSFTSPTATAECDELSALYAFLVERGGVKSVGLFWPYPNHTVAVWTLQPVSAAEIRIVVPTSQIFLDENDTFDTHKFNPWRQKTIYEYTRRDVADSYELPPKLFTFFIQQVDKYAGASNYVLQQLRYLRDGVLQRALSPEQAAREAIRKRDSLSDLSAEDRAAFDHFAQDVRSGPPAF
jgi:hypothetical protein